MANLSISLLGTFQISLNDQIITRFRSSNVKGLLVYLVLQAERPLPRDVLTTQFWPEESGEVAKTNFRQSLYQLRKIFKEPDKQGQPYLIVNRQNVQFNPACDYTLDVDEFLQAVDRGDLATAVSFYQGELLPGFSSKSILFEAWLLDKRESLNRLALDALHKYAEQLIGQGEFTRANTIARQQLTLEPWREEAHRQLMLTLVLNGERSAALAQFDHCRALLLEELGAEPEAATVELFEKIKAGDEEFIKRVPPSFSISSLQVASHNLTAQVAPFFNREALLTLLTERIPQRNHRLVTLVGEGGMGKSRLAQEVGWQLHEQFEHGVWFVSLAGLASVEEAEQAQDDIVTAIAQVLKFPLQGQKPPREQIISFLRGRNCLLILDNFEHVLAGADLVMTFLQEAPEVAVLCTSRQPLHFMAEWVVSIDPLLAPPLPFAQNTAVSEDIGSYPAVQLFVDRAERVDSHFALTNDNAQYVVQICDQVAGLPLALELAAASLRRLSLAELNQSIQTTIDTLMTQFRDIPPRHRSMRAVFNNAWVLLNQVEQNLLATLSVFRGGFTAVAAKTIANTSDHELQLLVEKSLLRQDENGRFQMHELLRQFTLEKCTELELDESVANQHSDCFLTFVAEQEDALIGEAPQVPVNLIAADLDNVRKAWETAVAHENFDQLLACAPSLADFYQIRGLYREGERFFAQAVAASKESESSNTSAYLKTYQAGLLVRLSRYESAIVLIQEALPIAQQTDNAWLQSRLYITFGEANWRQGQFNEAETHLKQALQIAQAQQLFALMGFANFHLGVVYDYRGRHEESLTLFEETLALWQQLKNRCQQGVTFISIGAVARHLSQINRAKKALHEAFVICQDNNDLQGQSMALNNLSILATREAEFEVAKTYLSQALQCVQYSGDEHGQALIHYNLGWNAYQAEWVNEAQKSTLIALQLCQKIGDQRGESQSLQLLGDLANSQFADFRTTFANSGTNDI